MISPLVLYSSRLYRPHHGRASAFLLLSPAHSPSSLFLSPSASVCLPPYPLGSGSLSSSSESIEEATGWRAKIRILRNSNRSNVRTRGETRSAELSATIGRFRFRRACLCEIERYIKRQNEAWPFRADLTTALSRNAIRKGGGLP